MNNMNHAYVYLLIHGTENIIEFPAIYIIFII